MSSTERLRALLDERGVEYETRIEIDTGIEHIIWHPTELSQWDWNEEFGAGWLTGWQQGVTPEQAMAATLGDSDATEERQRDAVEVVRCRDCKHGHITINGESCKWCDLIATHDIDGNEPNNGYDPEPYFDADFFCAWGRRADG